MWTFSFFMRQTVPGDFMCWKPNRNFRWKFHHETAAIVHWMLFCLFVCLIENDQCHPSRLKMNHSGLSSSQSSWWLIVTKLNSNKEFSLVAVCQMVRLRSNGTVFTCFMNSPNGSELLRSGSWSSFRFRFERLKDFQWNRKCFGHH